MMASFVIRDPADWTPQNIAFARERAIEKVLRFSGALSRDDIESQVFPPQFEESRAGIVVAWKRGDQLKIYWTTAEVVPEEKD